MRIQAPDGSLVEFPDGTPDDEVLRVMRQNFGGPQQPAQPAPQAQPVTAGRSFMQGVTDPIQGGAQLAVNALPNGVVDAVNGATAWVNRQPVIGPVTQALGMTPATREQINQQTTQREQDYQASRQAAGDTGVDWWRMGGQTAAAVPMAVALPAGSSLAGSIAAGAGTGAAMSALQPVTGGDYWDQKKEQVETGAAVGAVTGPLSYMAGRALSPRVDDNVRRLGDRGVQMTPGQMVGGAVRRVEDASTSVPFVGDVVRNAQRRSIASFNRATANEVLAPIGAAVPDDIPAGREMISHVTSRINQVYDAAAAQARPFQPDAQFAQEVQQVAQRFLTPESGQTFIRRLQNDIVSRMRGGQIDGATYQTIKSRLGQLATEYRNSPNPADRELGAAFGAVQDAMKGLLARTNPHVAPMLQQADAAWAGLVRLNDAASRVGAVEGVFTPAQLSGAVRSADRSLRHGAYARGDAMLQDLSDAGRAVLPSTVPDSGSAGRIATMGALAGGANMAGYLSNPALATGGAIAGAYTPAGQRAIQAFILARRPYAVRAAGDLLANSGGATAAPLAAALMGRP